MTGEAGPRAGGGRLPPVAIRHGRRTPRLGLRRSELKKGFPIAAGRLERFTCRNRWQVALRVYLRQTLDSDRRTEAILCMGSVDDGAPERVAAGPPADGDWQWTATPPLKRRQLVERLERCRSAALQAARQRALAVHAQSQARSFERLTRLHAYYRQLGAEAGDDRARKDIEHECRLRLETEAAQLGVRGRLRVVGIETYSEPVFELGWDIWRGQGKATVRARVSRLDGRVIDPVVCAVCGRPAAGFGLTVHLTLACNDCLTRCDVCGTEVAAAPADRHRCHICGRVLCPDHAQICGTCRRTVCPDHLRQCQAGCGVCPGCVRTCPDCPPFAVWCPDHSLSNGKGQASCRAHAIHCVGCREPFAAGTIDDCAACGQAICRDCGIRCRDCGRRFCQYHIQQERCQTCRSQDP